MYQARSPRSWLVVPRCSMIRYSSTKVYQIWCLMLDTSGYLPLNELPDCRTRLALMLNDRPNCSRDARPTQKSSQSLASGSAPWRDDTYLQNHIFGALAGRRLLGLLRGPRRGAVTGRRGRGGGRRDGVLCHWTESASNRPSRIRLD